VWGLNPKQVQNIAYFGHLAMMANMISDLVDEVPAVSELIEMSEQWKKFTAPEIDKIHEEIFPQ